MPQKSGRVAIWVAIWGLSAKLDSRAVATSSDQKAVSQRRIDRCSHHSRGLTQGWIAHVTTFAKCQSTAHRVACPHRLALRHGGGSIRRGRHAYDGCSAGVDQVGIRLSIYGLIRHIRSHRNRFDTPPEQVWAIKNDPIPLVDIACPTARRRKSTFCCVTRCARGVE
jgi:hypothetical protein